jgi:hypothetical protein
MIEVKATPCVELGMKECQRCRRFTSNDGPSYKCKDGTDGVICWRCQHVLITERIQCYATNLVIRWRLNNNLPIE